ncbi:hypothetical protein [Massilia sp. CT11-137]|uniref:hypothetical protein n=1 Tax=Massilia sp. CT11-137 TaxID=3393901 RepID=UPI0039AF6709
MAAMTGNVEQLGKQELEIAQRGVSCLSENARHCHLLLGQRRVKWVRVTRAVAHDRYEKRERLLFGEYIFIAFD